MPAKLRGALRLIPTEERELLGFLNDIPDEQVVCRAGRHDFPWDRAVIGKPLPRGVSARPSNNGCFQILDLCSRCGTLRIGLTLPGGEVDADFAWSYRYPEDWVTVPHHLPHGRGVLRREKFRRTAPQIKALIRSAAVLEEPPARKPVAQAVFQGVS
jgi:hypothetical protein